MQSKYLFWKEWHSISIVTAIQLSMKAGDCLET